MKPVLKTTSYDYTGKDIKPAMTLKNGNVTLKSGTDYTVTYSSCREVGTAKATVKGIGNYTGTTSVSYTIQLPEIKTLKSTSTYKAITVSWKKVPGASGYAVYRRTSLDGKYTRVGTVKSSAATLSFTNNNLKTNNIYYYMVRSYRTVKGQNVYSPYSNEVKQKVQVSAPTVKKVSSAGYNALTITWGKVEGADGYAIYRSTARNGKYTRIGTAVGGSKESFTDKKCTCGRYYYYKVRAYRKVNKQNCYGDLSESPEYGKSIPEKVKINSNATQNYSTKIVLKWNRTAGASGYEVFRSTAKNGKYTKLKTITKGNITEWTNTGLKKGKIYYYKVRAYRTMGGKKVYGYSSAAFKKGTAGWRYVNGYKLYYNSSGKLVKDVSKIIGKQSSYVIKVNKKKNTVTVYAKDGKNGYIIPVKAFVCSVGYATPTGTFYTPAKYRWHTLMGPCWGQWDTRIVGGILFHSVFYSSPNNNMTLSTSAYNKLGTTASHGCVRLKAGDAKWIYDNCKLKTKVVIYNGNTSGPLGKPTAYKLKSSHRWDPTDPTAYYKCKRNGCH
ncbi:MAG: L,D-transpeptidase family protein [Lachnospiraceae bacterium]|nr:L,D-transpeptidase family protein [Lachnospiraceae bacterium]